MTLGSPMLNISQLDEAAMPRMDQLEEFAQAMADDMDETQLGCHCECVGILVNRVEELDEILAFGARCFGYKSRDMCRRLADIEKGYPWHRAMGDCPEPRHAGGPESRREQEGSVHSRGSPRGPEMNPRHR